MGTAVFRLLTRLRVQLLLLVLVAIIPIAGLLLYGARQDAQRDRADAKESALRVARAAASQQDDSIVGAQQLLLALTQVATVRPGADPAACSALLARMLAQTKGYSTFSAVDLSGNPYCTAAPAITS